VLSWRPLADFESAKIGLAPPHAVLTLDDRTLAFGVNAVTGPQRYVRLGDLADTAAAHVLSWRPAGDFDPAKIGLAPPRAVLELDGQRLEFGESSVTGPQHYVRIGQRVALVSSRYVPRSPATPTTELH
jgi:hypothetical protein